MSAPPAAPAGNPVLDYYQQWSSRTPFVSRWTCIWIVIVYILSWIFRADMSFGNIPFYTLTHFEVYRLILSPLVGNSLLNVVILLFMFPSIGQRMEASMGSLSFLNLMATITLVVNASFSIFCLLLSSMGEKAALFYSCSGFFTIVMALITVDCMNTPDVPRLLLVINVPSKYLPLILLAIFSLLGGSSFYSHAISVCFGYLYSWGYFDRIKPSAAYLASFEAPNGIFHSLSRSEGWVLAGSAFGHEAWLAATTSVTSAPPANPSRGRWGTVATIDEEAPPTGGQPAGPPKPHDMFPGSGHKLAPAAFSLSHMMSEESGSSKPSREDVAARRLAAMGVSASATTTSAATAGADTSAVMQLQRKK